MPTGSTIVITVAGVNVTNKVLFSSAKFEAQLGAIPGTAEMTLKDVHNSLSFVTGDEWTVDIDGIRFWGGYVLRAYRTFAFPAVDTSDISAVSARQWKLEGIDYNILFDKRVIHNADDHLHHLPYFALDKTMGELLRDQLFASYLDIGGDGLDTTTFVDNLYVPRFDAGQPGPRRDQAGLVAAAGLVLARRPWRTSRSSAPIYYIDADQGHPLPRGRGHGRCAVGLQRRPEQAPAAERERDLRDARVRGDRRRSAMANDAFVWGGSEWAGPGGTVFARKQNSSSITDHNRWQYAETRFGDLRIRARSRLAPT
jgi:hypothetical protein